MNKVIRISRNCLQSQSEVEGSSEKEENRKVYFEAKNAGRWDFIGYYRFYVSFQFLEALFDLDESNICRHIQKIEPILASAIKINKHR